MKRWMIALLLAMIAASVVLVWTAGSIMTRGRSETVAAAVPPAVDLMLRSGDGLAIAATFRPGRDERAPAVLLLHGVGASRQATAANAA